MALTINGERIDDGVIDGEFSRVKSFYEGMGRVSCCERDDEFKGAAKQNIIGRVLLMQEAERRGQEPEESAVQATFDRLVEEHGAKEHVLLSAGFSLKQEDLFLEDLRANLRLEQMLEDMCSDLPEPDDDAVRAFYEQNIDLFLTAEEVEASHIFKNPQPVENKHEIFAALREVRKRARAGEDFQKLVEECSDKPVEESDLGFFKRGEIMEEFETIAFSMEVGEISPIFITQWGFHLAKLTGRKEQAPIPFEEVKDKARELLVAEARKKRVDRVVEELRAAATVEDDDPEPVPDDLTEAHAH
ncbi:N/A [soil metagenome]